MFYTIASRLIKTTSPQNNLYVFLVGSICYIILHWKLHLTAQVGIVEKVKRYLYYAMVADVGIAYALKKFYSKKQPDLAIDTTERRIEQKIDEVRKIQQQNNEQKKQNAIENKPEEIPVKPEEPTKINTPVESTQTPDDTDIPVFDPKK